MYSVARFLVCLHADSRDDTNGRPEIIPGNPKRYGNSKFTALFQKCDIPVLL